MNEEILTTRFQAALRGQRAPRIEGESHVLYRCPACANPWLVRGKTQVQHLPGPELLRLARLLSVTLADLPQLICRACSTRLIGGATGSRRVHGRPGRCAGLRFLLGGDGASYPLDRARHRGLDLAGCMVGRVLPAAAGAGAGFAAPGRPPSASPRAAVEPAAVAGDHAARPIPPGAHGRRVHTRTGCCSESSPAPGRAHALPVPSSALPPTSAVHRFARAGKGVDSQSPRALSRPPQPRLAVWRDVRS